MRTKLLGIGLTAVWLCSVSYAHAQKATEQFIPIGQSPGMSNKYTYIGVIDDADAQQRTITAGARTIKITAQTRIWLDRSALQSSNQAGTFADLQKGRTVEIKYDDPARPQTADWIKVQATTP